MIHVAYIETDQHGQFTFEQIAVLLRARGFENDLRIYTTPEDAMDNIPLERPDIVFLDLRARNGQKPAGLDLARALRQHPLCRNTVLVGMAEYAMPADRTAALAAGCDEFVSKPVRYQAVEDVISHLVYQTAH